jgi:hypothetical protein
MFVWAKGAFAAMSLLEEQTPSASRPLDILVEYLGDSSDEFRGYLMGVGSMPWAREDHWSVLAAYLIDRFIDLKTMVVFTRDQVATRSTVACWTPRAGASTSVAALRRTEVPSRRSRRGMS